MKFKYLQVIYPFCFLLFLGLSFSSCEKEDTTPPTLQLLSISEGDIFESNADIPLEINISDNEALASYKVVVRNLNSDELTFVVSELSDKSAIIIDDVMNLEVAAETEFDVEMTAEDNSGNIAEQKIRFKILPPPGGILALNFKLKYQDNPLVMFEHYDYAPDNVSLYFTRFSFFISKIILERADGTELLVKEVDFVNLTNDHQNEEDATAGTTYAIPAIEEGEYTAIKFALGVPTELNAMKPANFSVNHPLGRSGEYWEAWDSFVFFKAEGFIDTLNNNNFDLGMSLHTGSDEAYRETMFEVPITMTQSITTTLDFDIDLYQMLVKDGVAYELVNHPAIHDLSEIEFAKQLADNLIQSIE